MSDRATFEALRRGRRNTVGAVWMRFVAAPDGDFRVAYAITTSTGSAVTRNRARRRIRAILDEVDRAGQLPVGACLVGLRQPIDEHTFDQLRTEVQTCLDQVSA